MVEARTRISCLKFIGAGFSMYEKKNQLPIQPRHFAFRLALHVLAAAILLLGSLALGIWGYVRFEDLSLMDAFLNASMLLGGMGPVNPPRTQAGKLFAGCYALYAGLVFIVTAAIIFTPVVHRVLHKFHWDDAEDK